MYLYVLNCLYLGLWAILLVHCLRSKKLYPILVNGWGTKIFWLFTFVFFNPLLSLLYIICIFCSAREVEGLVRQDINNKPENAKNIHNPEKRQKLKTAIPVFAFVYTCLVLVLFEVPRTIPQERHFVMQKKNANSSVADQGTLLKNGMNIGLIDAANKIQTVSSESASDNMNLKLHNISLICKNDNNFLDRVALKMQKSLVELPYVDSVSFYSFGNRPEPNESPDVFITLEMPELIEQTFLLDRQMRVKIACSASSTFSEAPANAEESANYGSIVPFNIKSELQHTSSSFCIECPGTERRLEAKNISNVLTNAISKQFENLLDKYARLEMPHGILYSRNDTVGQVTENRNAP